MESLPIAAQLNSNFIESQLEPFQNVVASKEGL